MENLNEAAFEAFLTDMLHPVRSRLFVEVSAREAATAGELSKALSDIPQATLYRHLAAMVDHGSLKVVAEQKRRARHERVFAAGFDVNADLNPLLMQGRGDVYATMFSQYMIVFLKAFRAYAARPDIDIPGDGSGFIMVPVYATGEELARLMQKVHALLETLHTNQFEPGSGRRLHTIGLIVTPPEDLEP